MDEKNFKIFQIVFYTFLRCMEDEQAAKEIGMLALEALKEEGY